MARRKPRAYPVYTLKSPGGSVLDYIKMEHKWWSVYKYYKTRAAAKNGVARLHFLFGGPRTTYFKQPSGRVVGRKVWAHKRAVFTTKGWAVVQCSSDRRFQMRERDVLGKQLRR